MKSTHSRIYRPDLHLDALQFMTEQFHRLEVQVPPPQLTMTPVGHRMRYQEQLVEQAIILKLARQISGLKAIQLLADHGLTQEQGALQRILDDIDEDIIFLSDAKISGVVTKLHKDYLDDFWREPFNNPNPMRADLDYRAVPRKKIRAHASRFFSDEDPATAVMTSKSLQKAYSSFIHASAVPTMDIYSGFPARFQVEGLLGTPALEDAQHDIWNYFYRGLCATAVAAVALRDNECFRTTYAYSKQFEASGAEEPIE